MNWAGRRSRTAPAYLHSRHCCLHRHSPTARPSASSHSPAAAVTYVRISPRDCTFLSDSESTAQALNIYSVVKTLRQRKQLARILPHIKQYQAKPRPAGFLLCDHLRSAQRSDTCHTRPPDVPSRRHLCARRAPTICWRPSWCRIARIALHLASFLIDCPCPRCPSSCSSPAIHPVPG